MQQLKYGFTQGFAILWKYIHVNPSFYSLDVVTISKALGWIIKGYCCFIHLLLPLSPFSCNLKHSETTFWLFMEGSPKSLV